MFKDARYMTSGSAPGHTKRHRVPIQYTPLSADYQTGTRIVRVERAYFE